jgi:hypothetical protein
MRWLLPSVFVAFLAVACSGAGDNPLTGDGGGGTTVIDGGGGGSDGGGNTLDAGPCDAKCGINVPNGFTLVAATTDRTQACPQGWTTHDIVGDPKLADGACSCACNVSQKPTCNTGSILRHLDNVTNPVCGTGATTIMLTGQSCSVLPNYIYASGAHYSAMLPPTGGVCSWDAKADPQKVMAREARVCDVPANCQGAVCGAKNVCVVTNGDLACPPTFPVKSLIGASANVECSACSACKVEATCGGTLSLYTDYQCATGKTDFPVDGSCNKNPAQNVAFYSFGFQGSVAKSDCSGPAPMSAGTAKLVQPQTMCCQQ